MRCDGIVNGGKCNFIRTLHSCSVNEHNFIDIVLYYVCSYTLREVVFEMEKYIQPLRWKNPTIFPHLAGFFITQIKHCNKSSEVPLSSFEGKVIFLAVRFSDYRERHTNLQYFDYYGSMPICAKNINMRPTVFVRKLTLLYWSRAVYLLDTTADRNTAPKT